VAIGKLVPCLIPYKSIIYLKIFDQEKASFDRIKSCRFENFGLITKLHCSLWPGPVHSFPQPAHAHSPLPCFCTTLDTARPVPLSAAPAQLPGCRALFSSFLHVAPPAPEPPSSILLSMWHPRADPLFSSPFGATVDVCPLSPIFSSARESGRSKPPTPTPPPHSSMAKCLPPNVKFCHPSVRIDGPRGEG
jgi:hypothetical protein